jgi:hypothetical protein
MFFIPRAETVLVFGFIEAAAQNSVYPQEKLFSLDWAGLSLATETIATFVSELELRHPQSVLEFNGLAHGLKETADAFLGKVNELSNSLRASGGISDEVLGDLQSLYLSALNITGPHDALRASWGSKYGISVTAWPISTLIQKHLVMRLDYYKSCATLFFKRFTWPVEFEEGFWESESVLINKAVIIGTCDIICCNAIEYGGSAIAVELEKLERNGSKGFELRCCDNGPGMSEKDILQMRSENLLSLKSRFGLNAASKALTTTGCALTLKSAKNPTAFAIWFPCSPQNT